LRLALFLTVLLGLVAPRAARAEPTVALTYFDNNTGDPSFDPLGRGLADMLITDLSVLSSLKIVERARLNEVLSELELAAAPWRVPFHEYTSSRRGHRLHYCGSCSPMKAAAHCCFRIATELKGQDR
jgi:curli biogenesis system outer membrane secretion channel CsgG